MFYKVRHLSLGEEKKEKKLPNATEFIGSKLGLELSFLQMYAWMTTVFNTAHNTVARKNIISHVNNNAL